MARNNLLTARPFITPQYDENFFDDMHMIFMGMGRGEAGKYMYDTPDATADNNLWEQIVQSNSDYYVPQADSELLRLARTELAQYVPKQTPYIDFGVGGRESFERYVLPTMEFIKSTSYTGIDYDGKILAQLAEIQTLHENISIKTIQMDFFQPNNRIISRLPAFGVMNGVTLGNMYGSLYDKDIEYNLISSLKYLSQLTYFGWLLISIDTNQDETTLMKMYKTPLNSQLNIASLPRMARQLPTTNFDSSLFEYRPEWLPEQQLLAHIAVAIENQDFKLGEYLLRVKKNDKIHLFNSYKFRQDFFENCSQKANLSIQKSWTHKTGVMLYLLKSDFHQ